MINGQLSFLWFHERQPGTGHSGVWELNYGSMGTSWLCLDCAIHPQIKVLVNIPTAACLTCMYL